MAQVIQDLQEECSKYGQVLRVLVPRPPNLAASNELFGSNNYGKVGDCVPYFRHALIELNAALKDLWPPFRGDLRSRSACIAAVACLAMDSLL